MAYTRSEVVLSTDPLRLARSPEARALAVAPWTPPAGASECEEVIPDLLRDRVEVADSGCWEWARWRDPDGYGRVTHRGRKYLAHRFVYSQLVDEIPDGMQIDHVCFNRACVKPSHLEVVTPQVNTRRAAEAGSYTKEGAREHPVDTHCANGHPWTDETTLVTARGYKKCRLCRREQNRLSRQRVLHRVFGADGEPR